MSEATMKRYRVYMVEESTYEVEVEAENEDDAAEKAELSFKEGDYHFLCVGNRHVESIEPLHEAMPTVNMNLT